MVKMVNVCMAEIGDVDLAVSEIFEQLEAPGNLLNKGCFPKTNRILGKALFYPGDLRV
jgi:hypothetical protein